MNRKKLIRIFVCIILVALIICLVPLPVWHNMTLQGSQVTKEGEVLGDATVKLRVCKLHYLFKGKHVKGRDDRGNTTCYVASEDEEMQPKDILERFQRIGDSYWDKE